MILPALAHGERRSTRFCVPIADPTAHDRIREVVLEAYAGFEQRTEATP